MMTAHSCIVLFFTIIAVCIQECMATSPVAVDPTETKDETGKDNKENQGNVQVLWQNFSLTTELLFSI